MNQGLKESRETSNQKEAYLRLAAAIVEQAAKDAVSFRKNEVRKFFCDENSIFALCMPNTDGETFYNGVMHNYSLYGSYKRPNEGSVFL